MALSATFTYDATGALLSKTDAEGNTARYAYDGRGRRVSVADPDAGRHTLVYDATGNLLEHHRPDGAVERFVYDLASRALAQDWDGDGKPEVVNSWDGSLSSAGLLSGVRDPSGATTLEYDDRQRQVAAHVMVAGATYDLRSAFDAQDREYWHGYPDGSSVRITRAMRGPGRNAGLWRLGRALLRRADVRQRARDESPPLLRMRSAHTSRRLGFAVGAARRRACARPNAGLPLVAPVARATPPHD
jgi:YD repeat-containing protein